MQNKVPDGLDFRYSHGEKKEERDNKKRRAFCVFCSYAAQGLAELFARKRSFRQNTWPFQPDGSPDLFSTLLKVKLYMTVILYVALNAASSALRSLCISGWVYKRDTPVY